MLASKTVLSMKIDIHTFSMAQSWQILLCTHFLCSKKKKILVDLHIFQLFAEPPWGDSILVGFSDDN